MKLTKSQREAIKVLSHGDYKKEFRLFLSALGLYAETLNEALIYGASDGKLSLETRVGMTRSVVEIIKSIEDASNLVVEKEPEDTSNGPT